MNAKGLQKNTNSNSRAMEIELNKLDLIMKNQINASRSSLEEEELCCLNNPPPNISIQHQALHKNIKLEKNQKFYNLSDLRGVRASPELFS